MSKKYKWDVILVYPRKAINMYNHYISKLVRALLLVNLAGHTLLHGPLKFKDFFVAKLQRDISPNFLNL